mgnify:CR=1 FL=1
MQLISSEFDDGGEIPRECGYKNGNREPQLTIGGTPEGTKSLALIMDDPDAMGAVGKVWVHWVVWNLTWFADGKPDFSRPTKQGMTDFGTEEDLANEVSYNASPGDLLAHHALTIHRANANHSSNRPRRAIGFVYLSVKAKERTEELDGGFPTYPGKIL